MVAGSSNFHTTHDTYITHIAQYNTLCYLLGESRVVVVVAHEHLQVVVFLHLDLQPTRIRIPRDGENMRQTDQDTKT